MAGLLVQRGTRESSQRTVATISECSSEILDRSREFAAAIRHNERDGQTPPAHSADQRLRTELGFDAVELILVRHAEAESRVSDDGTPADPGLTHRGSVQAEAVARWVAREPIDRVVSSPSRRALETAGPTLAATGLELDIDERLCEIDPDASHYLSIEEERARDHTRFRERIAAYQADPRLTALSSRVEEGLSDWAARTPGGRVVVFCHGGVVNVWTRAVLGMTPGFLFEAQNASSHRYLVSRKGVRGIRSLNEVAYLPDPT